MGSHWLIGVEQNWPIMRPAFQACHPFRPEPLGVGSRLSRSIPGGSIRGPHIQEPETFLQRARPVLRLYEHAQSLLQDGIWVVCTDEKTSIQAREAEQAPRPAIPQHPVYQSPRYYRRGAVNLMAALSVADGLVYGQCHARKRFVDFRCFLETVVVPEAERRGVRKVALVLDNGTTHASKQLPRWASELAKS